MKLFCFYILVLFSSSVFAQRSKSEKIDSLGQTILEISKTTGGYVLIRKNDTLIYSKAVGYNDINSKTKINDSTIFPISSNTKAFNTVLLSQLVEQKKIDFYQPLKTYLPNLILGDEYVTNNLNVIDILTHRWGIPRYDFTYYLLTNKELENANESVFNKLKYLKINSAFRTQFEYGNNQYILASYLLEQIENTKWETQLKTRILIPLNMVDTHCDFEKYRNTVDKSTGYQDKTPTNIESTAPLYYVSGMGNMFSSIRDLDKWTRFLLNGNDLILSKDLIKFSFSNQFATGYEEPFEGFSSMSYGLGWYTFDYYGHKVVLHQGDNVGHQSLIVLLPEDSISCVIIANEGMKGYGFPFTMTYSLLDEFLGQKTKNWSSLLLNTSYSNAKGSLQSKREQVCQDISLYQGEYLNEGFGTIRIFIENGQLMIKAGTYVKK